MSLAVTAILPLANGQLMAQEDSLLNRQVTISRDYVPEASTLIKLDCQPAIEQPATSRGEAVFSSADLNVSEQRGFGVMPAQQVIAYRNPYTLGWVKFDMGNYWNTNLAAGADYKGFKLLIDGYMTSTDHMRWYDHADDVFGYDVYHKQGAANEMSLVPGSHWDQAKLMRGNARLSYDYTFYNDARLCAYVGARGQKMLLPTSYVTSDSLITGNTRQRMGAIEAGAALDYNDLHLQIDYIRSGVHYPDIADNDVRLSGEYGWYDDAQWRGKVGVVVGSQWDYGFHMTLLGKGELSFLPDDTKLNRFYLNAMLGTERPALFDLVQENPFLLPIDHRCFIRVKDTINGKPQESLIDSYKTPFHAAFTLGYESNENGRFRWGVYAGVHQIWNELGTVMMVHPRSLMGKTALSTTPVTPGNRHMGPFMRLVNHDCIEFIGGLHFDYELNRYFSATVDAQAKPHSCAIADVNDAHVSGEAHIKSNPIKALTLDVSFVGKYLREGTISTNFNDPKHKLYRRDINLHNIADLGFQADYALMDNLTIYAGANNLLCRRYELWPGIPGQKLNARLGATYRF